MMGNNTQRCSNCASLEAQNVLLDAKLAELEQSNEPVGHWSDCAVHSEPAYPKGECDCGGFATPPQRKPLSDEEIMDICASQWASHPIEVARAIEAAHGIGEKE